MSRAAAVKPQVLSLRWSGPAIFALVLVCYWPALGGGLVWDDAAHVTKPELRSLGGLARIWTDVHATQQFYPVLHSAFWLEHRLWGDATIGYHLINVVLHALACVLLARVLRRVWPGGPRGVEWVAAVLFAVHPVMVESVAWISEQKNTLSLVFYLAAARAYLEFQGARHRGWYVAATGFFLLALGTKSVTATLPAALLVVLWWRDGGLRWKHDVRPLLPWFAVAMVAGSVTAWVERTLIGAQGTAFDLSPGERCLLAGRVFWFYLGKLLWPADLMFIYPRWDVRAESATWIWWLVAAIGVTFVLWAARKRTRGPLAAWLFFGGSLFPALGFFNVYPFLFSYVADHFQYLASLGVIVAVAAGAAWIWEDARGVGRLAAGTVGAGVIGVLIFLSNLQSRTYRDGETLYRATLAKNPACWMAHSNLATELAATPAGVAEALGHFAEAIRLKPDSAEAHNNYGNALVKLGREAEAVVEFETALRIAPEFLEVRLNLANALAKDPARQARAWALYADAQRRRPDSAEPHFSLATTLAEIPGKEPEAEREYREALRLRPEHSAAEAGLASLLSGWSGRSAEAGAHFERALQLAPRDVKTRYNYALWLENSAGRRDDAAAEYEAALRIDPTHARAHNNLGILFARRKEFARAREHWEAAARSDASYEDPRRNLRRLDELERR